MAFMDDVLAQIQDPEQKKAFQGLPADVVKVLEAKAALSAEAQTKLAELDQAKLDLEAFKKANVGWGNAKKILDGAFGEKYDLSQKIQEIKARETEVARLQGEVNKLKPEAERAALLAKQLEGEDMDPAKITEMVLEKVKGGYLTKEEAKTLLTDAIAQSKHAVDFGSIPGTVKLIEHAVKAHNEFGLNIPAEDLASAASKYAGRPDAIELAYSDLTKTAREERAAKTAKDAADKYAGDLAAAKREGAESARREYEMAHIQGEESGSSVLGTVPLNSPKKGAEGVNPVTYDPSAGTLASRAVQHYKELEQEGFAKLM